MKVFVIDDHPIILSGLAEFLRKHLKWEAQEISSINELPHSLSTARDTDLLITDVHMPGGCVFETLKRIFKEKAAPRLVVYSAFITDVTIGKAIALGVSGIISKTDTQENLLECLQTVAKNGSYFSNAVRGRLLYSTVYDKKRDVRMSRLSSREFEVLRCVGNGQTNSQVANSLSISIKTVNRHKSNIMDKLSIRSSAEMMRYALEHGISDLTPT